MAEFIFHFIPQFSEGLAAAAGREQRIVAKAVFADGLVKNSSFAGAFEKDHFLRDSAKFKKGQNATKSSRAAGGWFSGQQPEQLGIVSRIRRIALRIPGGEARRIDAR